VTESFLPTEVARRIISDAYALYGLTSLCIPLSSLHTGMQTVICFSGLKRHQGIIRNSEVRPTQTLRSLCRYERISSTAVTHWPIRCRAFPLAPAHVRRLPRSRLYVRRYLPLLHAAFCTNTALWRPAFVTAPCSASARAPRKRHPFHCLLRMEGWGSGNSDSTGHCRLIRECSLSRLNPGPRSKRFVAYHRRRCELSPAPCVVTVNQWSLHGMHLVDNCTSDGVQLVA